MGTKFTGGITSIRNDDENIATDDLVSLEEAANQLDSVRGAYRIVVVHQPTITYPIAYRCTLWRLVGQARSPAGKKGTSMGSRLRGAGTS